MDDPKYADYWKSTPFTWKRPDGPPRVWRVVDGRKKMPNGEIPKFSIQEVPEELMEDFIDLFVDYFFAEEVICSNQNLANDPVGVREFRTVWRHLLTQGVSVVALLANSDPAAKPVIVGGNFLNIVTVEDKKDESYLKQLRSEGAKKVFEACLNLIWKVDVMKKYNVDKYLSAFGLSVHPDFRGQGLGEELLRARDDIGLAYEIPISQTIFTGIASQTVASRVGFESIFDLRYSEIIDDKGNLIFPGVKVEFMKSMAKRLLPSKN